MVATVRVDVLAEHVVVLAAVEGHRLRKAVSARVSAGVGGDTAPSRGRPRSKRPGMGWRRPWSCWLSHRGR